MLPNFYLWWDPTTKNENPSSSPWQYNRYPIHALMANLELGFVAARGAETAVPEALAITMISNDNDRSVNNQVTADLVKTLRPFGSISVWNDADAKPSIRTQAEADAYASALRELGCDGVVNIEPHPT